MKLLSIETSCDETSAAVLEKSSKDKTVRILSNVTATSLQMHAETGGIIPEKAAREQVKFILPVIIDALLTAHGKDIHSDQQKNTIRHIRFLRKRLIIWQLL